MGNSESSRKNSDQNGSDPTSRVSYAQGDLSGLHLWGNKKNHEFIVTVPDGVRPGQYFPADLNGHNLLIQCPPSNREGEQLIVAPPREQPSNMYTCSVPPNVAPGQKFKAIVDGVSLVLTCPADVQSGQKVTFKVPRSSKKIQARSFHSKINTAHYFQASNYKGLQNVDLLKKIVEDTEKIFKKEYLDSLSMKSYPSYREKVARVVLESNMAGIEEFSNEWYELIAIKMARNHLCRDFIIRVMKELGDETGYGLFEREIIIGSAEISEYYDNYYLAYLHAVQNPQLKDRLLSHPPSSTGQKGCYSHYTMIELDHNKNYVTVPFAKYFEDTLESILNAFDKLVTKLRAMQARSTEQNAYILYLDHYRNCLSSHGTPDELEALWTELDRKWMNTKGVIQIVHDIETGYGDVLRVKATPDFSLRFLDDSYAKENEIINTIQNTMMEYFQRRNTTISNNSLTALRNTMVGIYYIPFKTGMSLQFSFSGQSVPNRTEVSKEKGVKIYFDAIETEARIKQNAKLVNKLYASGDEVLAKYQPTASEQLVWHVAAHEVGHAIYNLSTIENSLTNPSVCGLLEEPRAELTAMWALQLLYTKNILTLEHLQQSVAIFALDGLRYFAKFSSQPLRPYIIFQIYAYKVYIENGYLIEDSTTGLLTFDDSKVLDVLQIFSNMYLRILDAMDNNNENDLYVILDSMALETDFVKRVVAKVM